MERYPISKPKPFATLAPDPLREGSKQLLEHGAAVVHPLCEGEQDFVHFVELPLSPIGNPGSSRPSWSVDQGEAELARQAARLPEIEAIKLRQGKKAEEAHPSMTHAEATVMKMGDGSFRPANDPQLASDADSVVIVASSRHGGLRPGERCGQAPEAWLARLILQSRSASRITSLVEA